MQSEKGGWGEGLLGETKRKQENTKKGECASVVTVQTRLNKGRKRVGHKTHLALMVAYL